MNKTILWSVLALAPQLAWAQTGAGHPGAGHPGAGQPGVSVYGVVDMALSSYRGEGAGSRHMVTSSGNQASRLGFKGRESLGDRLWAGFELESGLNTDTGTGQASNTNNQASGAVNPNGAITFNRKSYVYLEGQDWGQLRLGRDYTPAFWNLFAFDPFRVGVGMSGHVLNGTTATGFRASNSVGYFSPGCTTFQCKGLFFQGMLAAGENTGSDATKRDGNLYAWRLGYGGADFDIAVASATTKNAAVGDFVQSNIGGAYQWQGHRLMALVGQNKTRIPVAALSGTSRGSFWQLGAWISVGPGYIPVSYMQLQRNDAADSAARKLAVGYVHPLSKRTTLYGTYAHVTNRGALRLPVSSGAEQGPVPVLGGNASGFDLGIRHVF
ncbi:porin [Comamonas sp.]|uniref:porin n=1 Tax=Comamonas sp. TaxID=34028 RepID=UPI002FC6C838